MKNVHLLLLRAEAQITEHCTAMTYCVVTLMNKIYFQRNFDTVAFKKQVYVKDMYKGALTWERN